MKIKQSGMILLATVIILSFIAALLVNLEQLIFSYMNLKKQIIMQHEAYDALEAVAVKLSKSYSIKASCTDKAGDINTGIQQLKSGKGCITEGNQIAYRYWVSVLGVHHVLSLQPIEKPHMKLSLRLSSDRNIVSLRYIID